MKANLATAVFALIATVPVSESAGQTASACNQLIRHGINNIITYQSADHAIAYKYHKHCGQDIDHSSDSTVRNIGVSIFGYGSGNAGDNTIEARKRIKKWCTENKNFAESKSELFEEASTLSEPALESWNRCQELLSKQIRINMIPNGEHSKYVHFEIDSTQDSDIYLLNVEQKNYTCTTHVYERTLGDRYEAQTTNDSLVSPTNKPIAINNTNIHIECTRAEPIIENDQTTGKITYEEGYISISTSGPALPVSFPKVVESYTVTPPKSVLAFASTTCPAGWRTYNKAQGRFIRGIDLSGSTATDPDGRRDPGDIQDDEIRKHAHPGAQVGSSTTSDSGYTQNKVLATPLTGEFGGEETRPKNVALLFCEKL